ncbi:helix-turn-helix domain-containing protein [Jiella sp. M17.18]|uniref:helix-turn-helix domain-containing protein n=1 Tax=Jiella sp. M17.18 TaxID=3234247 RepID=UPI0034DDFE65
MQRYRAIDVCVGQRLREIRISAGLSQARLGSVLGLTPRQIQSFEDGTMRIGAGRLYEICRIFSVTPVAFFERVDGEGPAKAPVRSAPQRSDRTSGAAESLAGGLSGVCAPAQPLPERAKPPYTDGMTPTGFRHD